MHVGRQSGKCVDDKKILKIRQPSNKEKIYKMWMPIGGEQQITHSEYALSTDLVKSEIRKSLHKRTHISIELVIALISKLEFKEFGPIQPKLIV
jgi:hypothetical protein